jgi:hypothetical protein
MKKSNILLLSTMLCFCSMVISGFVLLLGFHHGHHAGGYHSGRFSWVALHIFSSLIFVFLVVYHLTLSWPWIYKNIITEQCDKQGKKLKGLCRTDICCFVLFLILAISGYLLIFLHKNSHLLKGLHYKFGIAFTIFILIHLKLHKYPSEKYLK